MCNDACDGEACANFIGKHMFADIIKFNKYIYIRGSESTVRLIATAMIMLMYIAHSNIVYNELRRDLGHCYRVNQLNSVLSA